MGLTGNSRERQFSLRAGAARLHRFVEQTLETACSQAVLHLLKNLWR